MNHSFTQLVHALASSTPATSPAQPLSVKPRPLSPGFPSTFAPAPGPAKPATPALAPHANFPAPTAPKGLSLRPHSNPPVPVPPTRTPITGGSHPPLVADFPKPEKKRLLPAKLSLANHLATLRTSSTARP